MQIDQVCTCSFDMQSTRKFDIVFLESNSEFFIDSRSDSMLIESTEDFPILSLESELECLSVEFFLDFESILKAFTCLVLKTFFICLHLGKSIFRDFSSKSLGYEEISCFG